MANIKDVAKVAGVSISTVSNVINNTKFVSDELCIKINKTINDLQYEVNPVGRSLKSKKTMTIGVVITNINRVFFPQVIKGIQDNANGNGYNLTFCDTNDDFKTEKKFVQMLESNWVDGIILDTVADTSNKDYFKYLSTLGGSKKHIPVISLERNFKEYGIDSVAINNYQGGKTATKHLLEKGCKNLIQITGPAESSIIQDRLKGFKDQLEEYGIQPETTRIFQGDYSPQSGYNTMKKALQSGINIDGVFASNDQMGIGAIKAIKENGYKIPEDIKVIGFDNTFPASLIEPALSTVNVPKYKMGDLAVDILIDKIENNNMEIKAIELPINLIVRQSTDLKGDKSWDLFGW